MKISKFPVTCGLAFGLLALNACGGSDGGGDISNPPPVNDPPVADTTPDDFTFTPVENLFTAVPVTSLPVTIEGIDTAAEIAVSGGEYAINDGPFTSAPATINANDTVRVRVTASEKPNTAAKATLHVGDVSSDFVVTTGPAVNLADVNPAPFAFASPEDVEPGKVYTSESVVIRDINAPAPVSIFGGMYRIGGAGEFTNATGTVFPGQRIAVRVTAPGGEAAAASADSVRVATLTIGEFSQYFFVAVPPAEGAADTVPEPLVFAAPAEAANAEPDSAVIFGPANITGLSAAAKITIADGEYSLNGAGEFTEADGLVTNGSSVQVRVQSSKISGAMTSATVTIGGVPATLPVITRDLPPGSDVIPDAFQFEDATVAEAGLAVESNGLLLEGFDGPLPLSIEGGEFQIARRGYTARAQLLLPGQVLYLRGVAPALGETHTVTLTAGGVVGTFAIHTREPEPENRAPVADITGPEGPVAIADGLTLDAGGSSDPDGDTLSYRWTQTEGPAGGSTIEQSPETPEARVAFTVAGDYVFQLSVSDGELSDTATVAVRVLPPPNEPPTVEIEGPDVATVGEPIQVSVIANDLDGDELTYEWSAMVVGGGFGGGIVEFLPSNASATPTAGFTAPANYVLTVTVSDGFNVVTNTLAVEVTLPDRLPMPVLDITPESPVVGQRVTLNGSRSTDDHGIVSWAFLITPEDGNVIFIEPSSSSSATFTPEAEGSHRIVMTVADDAGQESFVEAFLVVASSDSGNTPPVANAGIDTNGTVNTLVTLDGSGSRDEDDGDTLSYSWKLTVVPVGSRASIVPDARTPARATFTPDVDGTYEARLTVTDSQNATDTDDVTIQVSAGGRG